MMIPQVIGWRRTGARSARSDCGFRSKHGWAVRRQDPLFHLLPAFAFGTNAFVNRSFSGSFFSMTPLLWSQLCTAFHRAGSCLSSLGKNGSVAPNVLADSVGSAIAFALL